MRIQSLRLESLYEILWPRVDFKLKYRKFFDFSTKKRIEIRCKKWPLSSPQLISDQIKHWDSIKRKGPSDQKIKYSVFSPISPGFLDFSTNCLSYISMAQPSHCGRLAQELGHCVQTVGTTLQGLHGHRDLTARERVGQLGPEHVAEVAWKFRSLDPIKLSPNDQGGGKIILCLHN